MRQPWDALAELGLGVPQAETPPLGVKAPVTPNADLLVPAVVVDDSPSLAAPPCHAVRDQPEDTDNDPPLDWDDLNAKLLEIQKFVHRWDCKIKDTKMTAPLKGGIVQLITLLMSSVSKVSYLEHECPKEDEFANMMEANRTFEEAHNAYNDFRLEHREKIEAIIEMQSKENEEQEKPPTPTAAAEPMQSPSSSSVPSLKRTSTEAALNDF